MLYQNASFNVEELQSSAASIIYDGSLPSLPNSIMLTFGPNTILANAAALLHYNRHWILPVLLRWVQGCSQTTLWCHTAELQWLQTITSWSFFNKQWCRYLRKLIALVENTLLRLWGASLLQKKVAAFPWGHTVCLGLSCKKWPICDAHPREPLKRPACMPALHSWILAVAKQIK